MTRFSTAHTEPLSAEQKRIRLEQVNAEHRRRSAEQVAARDTDEDYQRRQRHIARTRLAELDRTERLLTERLVAARAELYAQWGRWLDDAA